MSYKPNFSDAPEFSIIPDAEKLFEEITVLFSYLSRSNGDCSGLLSSE